MVKVRDLFDKERLRESRLPRALLASIAAVALSGRAVNGQEGEPPRNRPAVTAAPSMPSVEGTAPGAQNERREVEAAAEDIRNQQLGLVEYMLRRHGADELMSGMEYSNSVTASSKRRSTEKRPDANSHGTCEAGFRVINTPRTSTVVHTWLECTTYNGTLKQSARSTWRSTDTDMVKTMTQPITGVAVLRRLQEGGFTHDETTVMSETLPARNRQAYIENATGVQLDTTGGLEDVLSDEQARREAIAIAQNTLGPGGLKALVEAT